MSEREIYVPLPIGPDPDRDARVMARRAESARKASVALDRLLADRCDGLRCTCCGQLSDLQDAVRDALSQRHHNGHYDAPEDERPMHYCADDNRTACGGWAGMVYQYTADESAVTCTSCLNGDRTHAGGSS